jgi:hypothetical protein
LILWGMRVFSFRGAMSHGYGVNVWAIFEKQQSIRCNQEPCLGV